MIDTIDIAAGLVTHVCPSCGAERSLPLSSLKLGFGDNPNAIEFPRCACGAQEFCLRTWEPDIDFPHRRAINALAEHLKDRGQSGPSVKTIHAAEKKDGRSPPLVVDLAKPVVDITGRAAAAERTKRAEAEARRADEASAASEATAREAQAARARKLEEDLLVEAERRRAAILRARANKRLGLPPGSEPPPEEIEREAALAATPSG